MFSNGTEYDCFLENNCFKCKKYVQWEYATKKNPVCRIEEEIALGGVGQSSMFPYEKLTPNGYMHRYDCKEKESIV